MVDLELTIYCELAPVPRNGWEPRLGNLASGSGVFHLPEKSSVKMLGFTNPSLNDNRIRKQTSIWVDTVGLSPFNPTYENQILILNSR